MSKNINPREKAENKQKIKNIIFKVIHGISYVCTGLFVAVCIVSCAASQRKQANAEIYPSEIQYRIDDVSESESYSEVSYPIYDDTNQTITLSAYQVNNYIFENLYNVQINGNDFDFSEVTLSYLSSNYIYDEQNEGVEWFSNSENYIVFVMDYNIFESYNQEILTNYKFYNRESGENLTFINDLIIINNQSGSAYQELKTAIQADIQANEQSDNIDVGIFDGISQSLTAFIGTLNSGLTAIIGIFWNSTTSNLTPLGILTTLVVGVALCYFVFRLIIGLIRLRG